MYPKVTCGAIIERKGKILLTKRNVNLYKNFWCLPGGHVEFGERIEEAIKREVKEETGLDFEPNFFKYQNEIIPERKWHALVLFFAGGAKGRIKINQEVKAFRWFSRKEINKIPIAFLHREIIKSFFSF